MSTNGDFVVWLQRISVLIHLRLICQSVQFAISFPNYLCDALYPCIDCVKITVFLASICHAVITIFQSEYHKIIALHYKNRPRIGDRMNAKYECSVYITWFLSPFPKCILNFFSLLACNKSLLKRKYSTLRDIWVRVCLWCALFRFGNGRFYSYSS